MGGSFSQSVTHAPSYELPPLPPPPTSILPTSMRTLPDADTLPPFGQLATGQAPQPPLEGGRPRRLRDKSKHKKRTVRRTRTVENRKNRKNRKTRK